MHKINLDYSHEAIWIRHIGWAILWYGEFAISAIDIIMVAYRRWVRTDIVERWVKAKVEVEREGNMAKRQKVRPTRRQREISMNF